MKVARAFWHEIMFAYEWNHHISLPIDFQRYSDERRSGRASTASLTFDDELAKECIKYAAAKSVPLLTLFLTCYYLFLFKLTNIETDLCVAMNMSSRYKPDLNDLIGNFMNL